MQPSIRKAALRAAAKLAFSVTLVGCAAHDPSAETTTDETDTANQQLRRHHPVRHAGICGTTDGGTPNTYAKQCCEDVVHASFTKTGVPRTSGAPASADTKACCSALAAFHDLDPNTMFSWPERAECCETLGWSGAASCTPWGPPVPPAMRRRTANLGVS